MIVIKNPDILQSQSLLRSTANFVKHQNSQTRRFEIATNFISNDMPESGGGGASAGVTDGPDVAASDDDDGGDGDGEPARRPRSKKSPPSFPPALLGFAPLSHYVGFGRSRIYQLIGAGEFPPPLKVGKSSRWVRAEIDTWLSKQIAARNSLSAG